MHKTTQPEFLAYGQKNLFLLAFTGTSVSMLVLDYAYDLLLLQIVNPNNIGIAVM